MINRTSSAVSREFACGVGGLILGIRLLKTWMLIISLVLNAVACVSTYTFVSEFALMPFV